MKCYVGIDIGAVSATAAVICPADAEIQWPEDYNQFNCPAGDSVGYISPYKRTRGKPVEAAETLLDEIASVIGRENIAAVTVTGSGAKACAGHVDATTINEFSAIAFGLSLLDIQAKTVFEMGGETCKYMLLEKGDEGYGIIDYSTNGDCAAGTGSFIDQQANRLRYKIQDIGSICSAADRSAQVAGRCSVFAKSDMIHAQQKGYNPAEVMRGLCDAVARNFKSAVVRSHRIEGPVVFIGGVTQNSAVVRAMNEVFGCDLAIPEKLASHIPAIGAAYVAANSLVGDADQIAICDTQQLDETKTKFPRQEKLNLANVTLLRDSAKKFEHNGDGRIDAYLGIDIGSVSTNVVVVDVNGHVIEEIYTRTQGRPIEVVAGALEDIKSDWAGKLCVRGVGTTGSGRELIGELIGADTINDEITAHKTGATFIGKTLLDGRVPDTIFEIGGQDSKYISLSDGVVVDFTMNEACAAGTGSFLEERAEELEVAIKGEFASLALQSDQPIRLGERCTVFMERDVNSYMQRGAEKNDLLAGLCYSVVQNYINRVVRGRKIGDTIFFQGGTAYNDATAAAFSMVTGKEIIVPPHNGVMGAIGSALLARDKMLGVTEVDKPTKYTLELKEHGYETCTKFRGYDLDSVDYSLREFTCQGCTNYCQIQEFTVEGEKTYWGDKCSDRFRKRAKTPRQPVIDDVMTRRNELLTEDSHLPKPNGGPTVGIAMTMFAWGQLPFWRTMLAELGMNVVLGEQTNHSIIKAGLGSVVAEPCFPIIVAHGHVLKLAEKQTDYILLPNTQSLETQWEHTESHLCPWHQTLPLVVRRAPAAKQTQVSEKLIEPMVEFHVGRKIAKKQLCDYFLNHTLAAELGISRKKLNQAIDAGYAAQDKFQANCVDLGRKTIDQLAEANEPGVVLLGRPYNVHDAGMNLAVARKLRDSYGVNVLPLDCLETADVDVRDVNPNMFWALGRDILAAAKIVKNHPNLHIIYITNFKCGPDSYIKQYIRNASGKPFLTLQFDGHSNDAGIMTRCEAYLDSKGFFK